MVDDLNEKIRKTSEVIDILKLLAEDLKEVLGGLRAITNMTDSELIDKYVGWEEAMENIDVFGLTEGAGIDEWRFIMAEIKRRGITDEQIEMGRKKLEQIREKERQAHAQRRQREMIGKCKHPKNKGKDCTAENCPYIVDDKGKTCYEYMIYNAVGEHCQYGERK